ncbi:MAG: mechanosensitive ion channel family protein [Candidatus Izemoplasmatales bacterium]|jgi:small conductance mechanosensitive channel|nr:mechanosensitive ion channel family protein [Candidatus Izemoplasmatales bacterium]
MKFKDRSPKGKRSIIIVIAIVFVLLLVSILGPIIFPNTLFSNIIENSVGKFFNLFNFFKNNYVIIIETLAIIFFMWLIDKVLLLLVSLLKIKTLRGTTIANLVNSTIKYLVFLIAVFLILSAWGVQTPTLLAGAGIIGLAISFGAQSLIEDIFSGLFIIFEKQFSVGDIIQIGDFRGVVKEISLRVTKFEDVNGDIKIINNSDIRGAINTTASLSKSSCEISINYSEDLEKVERIIHENLSDIKTKIPKIVEGPYYLGVQSLADSSVVLKLMALVNESDRFSVSRQLNREMKLLFDRNNIGIPFPQLVVHEGKKDDK